MLKKHGKFYADWNDEHGNRRRKAFKSPKAARRHQQLMRNQSALKKARASGHSAKSRRRGARAASRSTRTDRSAKS